MYTILTGIRANSDLTLGNFLGALLPMTRLANEHSGQNHVNIFVPDLHTVIAEIDGDLQKNIIRSIKYYLAAGLKVNQHVHIYRQSVIPAHAELTWLLNCVTMMGELNRMTQYKEKGEGKASVNVGVFDYPVLMAADILLYDAAYVPVGEDQFQHLELTRELAQRFNRRFGETFVVPKKPLEQVEFMHLDQGVRIRDLTEPTKKMSKSAASANSKIMLLDDPAQAARKIMGATTDSAGVIKFDMINQPGISNLLQIEAAISGLPLREVINTWAGETHYGDLKQKVAGSVSGFLTEFQENLAAIDDEVVAELLATGEAYAFEVATRKLRLVRQKMGLIT